MHLVTDSFDVTDSFERILMRTNMIFMSKDDARLSLLWVWPQEDQAGGSNDLPQCAKLGGSNTEVGQGMQAIRCFQLDCQKMSRLSDRPHMHSAGIMARSSSARSDIASSDRLQKQHLGKSKTYLSNNMEVFSASFVQRISL